MGIGVFAEVASKTTVEEFTEVLKIATEDIKFNNIGFNKRTKVKDLKLLLDRILNLVKGVQAYDKGFKS